MFGSKVIFAGLLIESWIWEKTSELLDVADNSTAGFYFMNHSEIFATVKKCDCTIREKVSGLNRSGEEEEMIGSIRKEMEEIDNL